MEATAKLRYLRITPRKVRVVADLIRGKNVNAALAQLAYVEKRAAEPVAKLLRSAVANAEQAAKDQNLDVDLLTVKELMVDQGPSLRRFMPRAMGRAFKVLKKTSHVSLTISDESRKKRAPSAAAGTQKPMNAKKKGRN
ncbi:MAG TPA: 50S ribosomal protein L22 [Myxococcales bacterium]|jgi:large subunit ribosomal protein L22